MAYGGLYYGQPVNRANPLNRGLLSWWRVVPWYASGPRWIDLAGRNHGTLTNAPVWGGTFGRPGGNGSLTFTAASSQRVACGDIELPTDKVTLAFWARPTSLASTHAFLSKWNNGVSSTFLIQNSFTTSTFRVFIATAATDTATIANDVTNGFVVNEWHHYVLVFDGSGAANADRMKLYRDGILQTFSFGGTIPAALVDSSASLLIGGETSIGRYTTGQIDSVRISNRVFTASDSYALYSDERFGCPGTLSRITDPVYGFSVTGAIVGSQLWWNTYGLAA